MNPYVEPLLYVRRPGGSKEDVYTFEDDDPYFSEISAFVDMIDSGAATTGPGAIRPFDESSILSSYEDAFKTFKFTWEIRMAGERAALKRKSS